MNVSKSEHETASFYTYKVVLKLSKTNMIPRELMRLNRHITITWKNAFKDIYFHQTLIKDIEDDTKYVPNTYTDLYSEVPRLFTSWNVDSLEKVNTLKISNYILDSMSLEFRVGYDDVKTIHSVCDDINKRVPNTITSHVAEKYIDYVKVLNFLESKGDVVFQESKCMLSDSPYCYKIVSKDVANYVADWVEVGFLGTRFLTPHTEAIKEVMKKYGYIL